MINFDKRRLHASVIKDIQQHQQAPYCLLDVPQIKEYLTRVNGLSDEAAYALSLKVEPREKSMAPSTFSKFSRTESSTNVVKSPIGGQRTKDKDNGSSSSYPSQQQQQRSASPPPLDSKDFADLISHNSISSNEKSLKFQRI